MGFSDCQQQSINCKQKYKQKFTLQNINSVKFCCVISNYIVIWLYVSGSEPTVQMKIEPER